MNQELALKKASSYKCILRREFILTVGKGIAGVGVIASGIYPAQALQKADKEVVNYQDTPNGSLSCSGCRFFDGESGCAVVDGKVSADGWCVAFSAS
ncbi:MAG: hypothetical protein DHS20C05_17330 [Hyphococcus sp.]|nr:MAG: hypothetical protein DHS20C05_17330 [Marinicaulis sp.]